jgi:hypothetical protein
MRERLKCFSAPAGTVTVILLSVELIVPPEGPIVLVMALPIGVPLGIEVPFDDVVVVEPSVEPLRQLTMKPPRIIATKSIFFITRVLF